MPQKCGQDPAEVTAFFGELGGKADSREIGVYFPVGVWKIKADSIKSST
jgi:hypothetical protein